VILTVQASIVRLNMGLLHLPILNDQSIPLAPGTAEDGSGTVKVEVKSFGEFELGIGDKADLELSVICCAMFGEVDPLHRSCRKGQALCSMRSFCRSALACVLPKCGDYWRGGMETGNVAGGFVHGVLK
jgi:hypothetical protein